MAAAWAAAALAWVLWLAPARVYANDFDQFQNARAAYDSGNYELAIDLFSGLLEDATEGDDRPLVIESRKYLAAAYLFMGRVEEAEQQLEQLLRTDPNYVLDPLAFPREVHEAFSRVRERLEQERRELAAEKARIEAEERERQALEERARRERMRRLVQLASTERVHHPRSRWIAMLPFGIGQFQNGNDGLGMALAISESTLLAAAVVTFVLHDDLPTDPVPSQRDTVRDLEPVYRIGNQVSMGLFAVVAAVGILDAQLRFKPSSTEELRRPLPPDLEGIDDLSVSISPGGLLITGRF